MSYGTIYYKAQQKWGERIRSQNIQITNALSKLSSQELSLLVTFFKMQKEIRHTIAVSYTHLTPPTKA